MAESSNALIIEGKQRILYAIACEEKNQFTEALIYYEEGIQLFLNATKHNGTNISDSFRAALGHKIEECMNRVEEVQNIISQLKTDNMYREELHLLENSSGFGYGRLFLRFLESGDTSTVTVSDPNISTIDQIQNFAYFCSVIAKSDSNIRTISLFTTPHPHSQNDGQQESLLNELKAELATVFIDLVYHIVPSITEVYIKFDNGWCVQMEHGLNYLQKPHSKVSVAFHEYDLRSTLDTAIVITYQTPSPIAPTT